MIRQIKVLNHSIFLLVLFCFLSIEMSGQVENLPPQNLIATAPQWAKLMYGDNPNVYEIQRSYNSFYKSHDFEKNAHTRYYKLWKRAIQNRIDDDGYIIPLSTQIKSIASEDNRNGSLGDWSLVGPIQNYDLDSTFSAYQVNVYCIDQSLSDSNVVYCGTESGEIYKSLDHGDSWSNVSLEIMFPGVYWNLGIRAIAIDPTNHDVVYFSANKFICKTTDGGENWSIIYTAPFIDGWGFNVETIVIHPNIPSTLFVASREGLLKSTDNGGTWNQVVSGVVYDVKFNVDSDNIMYVLRNNDDLSTIEFLRSTDSGSSFTNISDGWYSSVNINRSVTGGRIAVTRADASRVYAHLLGNSKDNDFGFIGLYRSDDSGLSWTLPNGPTGGPYDEAHPNIGTGQIDGSGVWATLYNCALLASDTDPDKLLIGGVNLWKSDDGGTTFNPLGGYVDAPFNGAIHTERFHVDMQDFRQVQNTTWVTTDGGIYRSFDFFSTTDFKKRNRGIHSTEFWGFGSGWNEDVLFGGAYHNGNMAFYENWGIGNTMNLAGGEPPTGYVNPGDNRLVYSSQIGGKYLPLQVGGAVGSFGFGIDPNESNDPIGGDSELEFDPRNCSIAYTGKDNQLWKTTDKGITFKVLNTFGNNPNDKITYIEVARSNPDIIHVCQRLSDTNSSALIKSIDGGLTWNQVTLPLVDYNQNTLLQVDPYDPMQIWLTFTLSGAPCKVFKSSDGGGSWTDLTTATISSEYPQSMSLIAGTNGGVYLCSRLGVFYRNNTMSDWICFSRGLPAATSILYSRPFYRDGKLRIATNKGIWESTFHEAPANLPAQIMVDEFEGTSSFCNGNDIFHFVDHSMLNHENATWNWSFENGTPSTANSWQANVTFDSEGTHLVTLQITDNLGNSDLDSIYITINSEEIIDVVTQEGFENSFPPRGFEIINYDGDEELWLQNDSISAYGLSSKCMYIPGYYSPEGAIDDATISIDLADFQDAELTFDVAYAIWGGNYIDTLEILISPDCGLTYDTLYIKGGTNLATAPANNTEPFVPTASQWRTETVDLSGYDGMDNLQLIFRVIQGWAQHMYIDNINLEGSISTAVLEEVTPESQLLVYPNPISEGDDLSLYSNINEPVDVAIYNIEGKRVYKKRHDPVSKIPTDGLITGTYVYRLSTSTIIKQGIVIIN